MIYDRIIRKLWFAATHRDAEIAHDQALFVLQQLGRFPKICSSISNTLSVHDTKLQQTLFRKTFENPIGLAGGFDKNGIALSGLAALGFGFLEVGSVTMLSQEGNPRPRMFRLPEDQALINRMGFNNNGCETLMLQLAGVQYDKTPLGINIGKSKATPNESASADYLTSFLALHSYGDYFVVNVSSPNTPNLRQLQDKDHLTDIIIKIKRLMDVLMINKPIFVKIAPDLSWEAIDDVIEVCIACGVTGIIATNTTISREGIRTAIDEVGGLSGKPLFARSLEIVRYIAWKTNGRLLIIGVGGISTAENAFAMFKAGASLVQILTGLVYEGPLVVRNINRGLLEIFNREGIKHISDIIGIEANKEEGWKQ